MIESTEQSRESSLDGWAKVVCIGFAVGCLVEVICFIDALGWLLGAELWLPLSVRNAATFVMRPLRSASGIYVGCTMVQIGELRAP